MTIVTEPVRFGASVPVVEVEGSRCGGACGGAVVLDVVWTTTAGGFTACAAVFKVVETGFPGEANAAPSLPL